MRARGVRVDANQVMLKMGDGSSDYIHDNFVQGEPLISTYI
jgi:hypothetical protein